MALNTLIELDHLAVIEKDAEREALQKMLNALERANVMAGGQDMTVPEAEEYLSGLARSGDQEAEKLLDAFNTPFR
jgi:hypothetical protein